MKTLSFNPRLNQNNYRKVHGYPKLSRHWKPSAVVKLATLDIASSFKTAEDLEEFISSIEETVVTEMDRQYNRYLRRSYRDRN